jgi:hypothetical protein
MAVINLCKPEYSTVMSKNQLAAIHKKTTKLVLKPPFAVRKSSIPDNHDARRDISASRSHDDRKSRFGGPPPPAGAANIDGQFGNKVLSLSEKYDLQSTIHWMCIASPTISVRVPPCWSSTPIWLSLFLCHSFCLFGHRV